MTRREALYEAYEDAFFALLMEDHIAEEGARLAEENRQLQQDADAAIPESAYRKGLKAIQRTFGKQQRRQVWKSVYGAVSKVAMVTFVLGLLFTSAYAVSPTVRQKTLSVLIHVTDVATEFQFVPQGSSEDSIDEGYVLGNCVFPTWPEGYEILVENSDSIESSLFLINNQDETIAMSVTFGEKTRLFLDSEDADQAEKIQVHGYDGILIEKDGALNLLYADTDHVAFVNFVCSDLDVDTALRLLSQIKILE